MTLKTRAPEDRHPVDRGCKAMRDQYGAHITCYHSPRYPEPCVLDFIEPRDYESTRIRQTPKAVRMLRQGLPQRNVAAAVGCTDKTLRRWIRLYEQER